MKIKIEDIKKKIEPQGWKIISSEYRNLDVPMVFECNEGHEVIAPWKKLRNNLECPVCKKNTYKKETFEVVPKKKNTYRVLALDQATHISGWSVLDNKKLVSYGTYIAKDGEEIVRFNEVKNWLINMIDCWEPNLIAIEGIQYQQKMGVTTFQTLARLQGILMECCYEFGIEFLICPTNTWRSYCKVKGRTRADKKTSIRKLVKEWFDITISEDEADAIGIGKYASEAYVKPVKLESWE